MELEQHQTRVHNGFKMQDQSVHEETKDPQQCQDCFKPFFRQNNLKEHIKNVHQEQKIDPMELETGIIQEKSIVKKEPNDQNKYHSAVDTKIKQDNLITSYTENQFFRKYNLRGQNKTESYPAVDNTKIQEKVTKKEPGNDPAIEVTKSFHKKQTKHQHRKDTTKIQQNVIKIHQKVTENELIDPIKVTKNFHNQTKQHQVDTKIQKKEPIDWTVISAVHAVCAVSAVVEPEVQQLTTGSPTKDSKNILKQKNLQQQLKVTPGKPVDLIEDIKNVHEEKKFHFLDHAKTQQKFTKELDSKFDSKSQPTDPVDDTGDFKLFLEDSSEEETIEEENKKTELFSVKSKEENSKKYSQIEPEEETTDDIENVNTNHSEEEMIEEKNKTDLFSVKSKEDSKDFQFATEIEPEVEMENDDLPWNPMDFCETVFSDNEEDDDVESHDLAFDTIQDLEQQNYSFENNDSTTESVHKIQNHIWKIKKEILMQNRNCETCGKSFSQVGNLKRHIEFVHNAQKDFRCNLCDKSFSVKPKLERHINAIHNGDRDHKCATCGKSFSQEGNLKRHIETIHNQNGDKSFKCEFCEKSFSYSHHMKDHIRRIHKGH